MLLSSELKRKARQARYNASEKGKARRKRYSATAKAQARNKAYEERHPERKERWSYGLQSYKERSN